MPQSVGHAELTLPVAHSFAAPEVLKGARYGGKEQDIWALGVLGYVLVCGASKRRTRSSVRVALTLAHSTQANARSGRLMRRSKGSLPRRERMPRSKPKPTRAPPARRVSSNLRFATPSTSSCAASRSTRRIGRPPIWSVTTSSSSGRPMDGLASEVGNVNSARGILRILGLEPLASLHNETRMIKEQMLRRPRDDQEPKKARQSERNQD